MRLNTGGGLHSRNARLRRVIEVDRSTTSDQTPVLHRTSIEVTGNESIELVDGVRDVEDSLVDGHHSGLDVESVLCLVNVLGCSVDAQRNDISGEGGSV